MMEPGADRRCFAYTLTVEIDMAAIFFDWIFVAIIWPWPIAALVVAFTSRPSTAEDRTATTIEVGRGINQ